MIKLIKNELIKIFKKKSIYITLLVILAFVVLTNCIYKFFYNGIYSYEVYSDEYIQYIKEEITKLDPNKSSDIQTYVGYKSQIELFDIMKKYPDNSWQRQVATNIIDGYLNEKNMYIYGEEKNQDKVSEVQSKIDELIKKLDADDWMFFAKDEKRQAQATLEELQNQKSRTEDKQELQSLEISIKNAQIDLEIANYRVEKQIKYGNDFMNRALGNYESASKTLVMFEENKQDEKYSDKREKNQNIERKEINKYIIENKIDLQKEDDVRGILINIFSEYGLFIIVLIIMIAGVIVSEEFNKGTIKLLLIKPYTRNKLLLAKFITVLIMIVFSIAVVVCMELLIGGIIFGYDSLSVPVLEYNFTTNTLETFSVFTYLGIQILTQLPKCILLATLAFACSTIFVNSPVAIAIPLLGYMSADIINALIIQFKVGFMNFFVSMNWNFDEYLFGNLPSVEGMNLGCSALICLVYFIIMIIPTFIIFKKKNIKNI